MKVWTNSAKNIHIYSILHNFNKFTDYVDLLHEIKIKNFWFVKTYLILSNLLYHLYRFVNYRNLSIFLDSVLLYWFCWLSIPITIPDSFNFTMHLFASEALHLLFLWNTLPAWNFPNYTQSKVLPSTQVSAEQWALWWVLTWLPSFMYWVAHPLAP